MNTSCTRVTPFSEPAYIPSAKKGLPPNDARRTAALRGLQVSSASSSRRRLRQRLQSRPKVGKPAGAGAALPPHVLAEAEERAKAAEAELMQWIEAELEERRARPSGRI